MTKNGVLNISDLSNLVEEESKEKERSEKEKARLVLLSLSNHTKWHLLQEFLIEIQADAKIKEGLGQRFPTQKEQLELLKMKIEVEFPDDIDSKNALLLCVPSQPAIHKWIKSPGWNDAVIEKMKSYGLFTPEKRAAAIEAMHQKAVEDRDVQAAKVWLTMSGDYTDKVDVQDTKFEKYKEYVSSLRPTINKIDEE